MNNKNFTIISDGSCDLPDEIVKEKDIKVVPFYISFDGNTYLKEKVDIGVQEFYNKLTIMLQLLKKKLLREMILFVFA